MRGSTWRTCCFRCRWKGQSSVRSREKRPLQLQERNSGGQGRSQEGRKVDSDDYFEEEGVELTEPSVCHEPPSGHICHSQIATCHLPPHFALVSLPTYLLPLAFSTSAASAHTNPLQHYLYPLFKGWGQLCVSPLQGPPLRTQKPKWGESPLPQS